MYFLITATSALALRSVAEKEARDYATFLGLLVGLAASLALTGINLEDALDFIGMIQGQKRSTGVE